MGISESGYKFALSSASLPTLRCAQPRDVGVENVVVGIVVSHGDSQLQINCGQDPG